MLYEVITMREKAKEKGHEIKESTKKKMYDLEAKIESLMKEYKESLHL